jgi:hypothetical protein
MKISMTLSEVLNQCSDWEQFCEEQGWSEWAVNEGGGDIQVSLSREEAERYGIIKRSNNDY